MSQKPVVPENERQDSYQYEKFTSMKPFEGTDRIPIVRKDIEIYPKDYAMLLYNVLSPSECEYYTKTSEELGLEPTGYQTNYRNNDRVVAQSEEVSKLIFERIKEHLNTIQLTLEENHRVGPPYFDTEGTWEPTGLNEMWRLCKYHPSGHFGPHFDGNFIRGDDERSMKTFMIYLNGGYQGGTTNFVKESQKVYKDSTGKIVAQEENILYRVVPEAGMAMIFNHEILHEGGELLGGIKYIMRSDVMYTRTQKDTSAPRNPNQKKAMELLKEAERLESYGKQMEAVELYQRAFKLWPEIEKLAF